jgi:hypothetical protein
MNSIKDTKHLAALYDGLSREKSRLASATSEKERELRRAWIAQREREIAAELKFLGMDAPLPEISDDDLMRELGA